eukprot:3816521-Pyramimonas_sp.AAC.1
MLLERSFFFTVACLLLAPWAAHRYASGNDSDARKHYLECCRDCPRDRAGTRPGECSAAHVSFL